jgi:hypothetical protein
MHRRTNFTHGHFRKLKLAQFCLIRNKELMLYQNLRTLAFARVEDNGGLRVSERLGGQAAAMSASLKTVLQPAPAKPGQNQQ